MTGLAIIGSTGSIGVSTLEVVESDPSRWRVVALACGHNAELLAAQVARHKPRIVAVADEETARKFSAIVGAVREPPLQILVGEEGLKAVATVEDADTVLIGLSGARGLIPAWEAVRAGKRIALANKEALVLAGDILIEEAKRRGAQILPVDSEHSAVFQLMRGVAPGEVRKIWLGASGGPFRTFNKDELDAVTPEQALAHPVWKMGPRITIDSATLMNKGLEIIEACRLFGVTEDCIGVFVHPQGLVHAMVELIDGVMLAHVSRPDMKGPIAYALCYPERPRDQLEPPDLFDGSGWSFEPADTGRFPCLELARRAVREGGTMPAALNAADELAVEAFLDHRLAFSEIPRVVESVMNKHEVKHVKSPEDALEADRWARGAAGDTIRKVRS